MTTKKNAESTSTSQDIVVDIVDPVEEIEKDMEMDESLDQQEKETMEKDKNESTPHTDSSQTKMNSTTANPRKRPAQDPAINEESRKRGARLFGFMKKTLTQAKEASGQKTEAEIKRQLLEEKLANKLRKEREELRLKRQQEEEEKKLKIQEAKKAFEDQRSRFNEITLKTYKENLSNFIMTKTNPPIFFLPAKYNQKTLEALEASKARIVAMQVATSAE